MSFYVEHSPHPHDSAIASEDIHVGELVKLNSSQKAVRLDGADAKEDFEGVADDVAGGDWLPDDRDDSGNDTYDSADDDLVAYGGGADGDVINVYTVETGGDDPTSPDISDGDVVGVPNTGKTDDEGRIVEEGYTDNATTYNQSNNNFVAIGKAKRDSSSSLDDVVKVEVRADL